MQQPTGGSGRDPRVIRVWREIRTSHLELLKNMVPSVTLFRATNYSFHPSLIQGLDVRRSGVIRTCLRLAAPEVDVVELNEPTMIRAWGELICYHLLLRALRLVRRQRRPAVVLFAIDNGDILDEVARRVPSILEPIARRLVRRLIRFQLRTFDRIAFGTSGAQRAYKEYGLSGDSSMSVYEELPDRCPCMDSLDCEGARGREVLFVGALEARKGIRELMAAWDLFRASEHDDCVLRVVGVGALETEVREWAASRTDVILEIDPDRAVIHERYRRAPVVVLLSQRAGAWREQVGLPLLEGLAHGCVCVTTTETGIAEWLEINGHVVLPPLAGSAATVDGLLRALEIARSKDVLADLPREHVRYEADRWLIVGSS